MDEKYRELERQCFQGDEEACSRAFIYCRRRGLEVEPRILYAGTRHVLQNQEPIDFRTLLNKKNKDFGPTFDALVFGQEDIEHPYSQRSYFLSIQAGPGLYCKPRKFLNDIYGYTQWEFMFSVAPVVVKRYFFEDDHPPWIEESDIEKQTEIDNYVKGSEYDTEVEWDGMDEAIVTLKTTQYDFGGLLYGFPHQDVCSPYDEGIGPYVETEKVQDIVDFLRARFGFRSFQD
jgi:hypothetical protein